MRLIERMMLALALAGTAAQAQPMRAPAGDGFRSPYRIALGNDAASRWSQMNDVPVLLKNEQRWSTQRVQSRWAAVARDNWSAALYMVRSRRAMRGTMSRLVLGDKVSRRAYGIDTGLAIGERTVVRLRAAVLKTNVRPALRGFGTGALKDRRAMIGAGIDLPGVGSVMLDYVRLSVGGGQVAGLPTRDSERSGSGPRLALAGTSDVMRGLGWHLTLASMREPDVGRIDSRAQLAVRLNF